MKFVPVLQEAWAGVCCLYAGWGLVPPLLSESQINAVLLEFFDVLVPPFLLTGRVCWLDIHDISVWQTKNIWKY